MRVLNWDYSDASDAPRDCALVLTFKVGLTRKEHDRWERHQGRTLRYEARPGADREHHAEASGHDSPVALWRFLSDALTLDEKMLLLKEAMAEGLQSEDVKI
jgi:hypothetical protein